MLQQMAHGWKLVSTNKRTLLLVAVYQLLWVVLLYNIIEHIVSPIVRALPNDPANAQTLQYFWLEARFLIAKTDIILPYLYLLIALLVVRSLIAPFVQGGIYGVLAKSKSEQTNIKFFSEIMQNWKPFVIYHWIKILAVTIPTIMLMAPITEQLTTHYFSISAKQLPWMPIILLVIWCFVISSIIYGLLIGLVNQLSWQQSLIILLKRALKLIGVAIIILLGIALLSVISQIVSLYMIGIISSALFFILPVIRTFLKAWTISTHMVQFEQ